MRAMRQTIQAFTNWTSTLASVLMASRLSVHWMRDNDNRCNIYCCHAMALLCGAGRPRDNTDKARGDYDQAAAS